MTNPRPLSLVAKTPDGAEPPVTHGKNVLRQWDPESQLVGALMHLPAAQVVHILEVVPDSVIWRPETRWAFEVIRHLVAGGEDPDPVVVLHTARQRPPADAAHPGEPVSASRHHQFAIHLANLYTQAVTPAAARQYAREVLDGAYRRAVELHGIRMAELAQSGSSRTQLADYLTDMRITLADLAKRAEAAARNTTDRSAPDKSPKVSVSTDNIDANE
jgi:replicative DNA helicase